MMIVNITDIIDDDGGGRTSSITEYVVSLIIIMNIYHALINTLSAHMILLNPNTRFYTHDTSQPK